jgi:hypothetical protein
MINPEIYGYGKFMDINMRIKKLGNILVSVLTFPEFRYARLNDVEYTRVKIL